MSEEKTKVLIPFRQPISITNPTQPGEDDEQVPVPIHIVVDNAADFPVCDCGGGGGGVARVDLTPLCDDGITNLVTDEVSGYKIVVMSAGSSSIEDALCLFDYSYDADPHISISFLIPNDTPFNINILPITSGAYFSIDPDEFIVVSDADDYPITDRCQQNPGHWEVDAEYGFIVIPGLNIPSDVDFVSVDILTQK